MKRFITHNLIHKSVILLFGLMFLFNETLLASYIPVLVKGFNEDVIAEGTGSPVFSTTADADNSGYFFIDSTFRHSISDSTSNYYLPANRKIFSQSTPNNIFELQPYDDDNSLRLDQNNQNGELTFVVPQSAFTLFLLATAANGSANCDITITFTDNSTANFNNRIIQDWYGGNPFAIQGIGRTFLSAPDPFLNAINPRLYEVTLPINSTQLIKKVEFAKSNTSSVLHIFGVSISPRSPYCVSGSSASSDRLDIGNVTFGGLNNGNSLPPTNNVTATNSYSDFTNLPPENFTQGSIYPFSISQITKFGTSGFNKFATYIDYNRDSIFDELYEKILEGNIYGGSGIYHFDTSLSISLNASIGITRMRVVLFEETENSQACGIYYNGETEDYTINIVAAPLCSGIPFSGLASSSDSSVCMDTLFHLKLIGNTLASGISYQWQSSIDSTNWININGANYDELYTRLNTENLYRCVTTCNNNLLKDTSTIVKISLNNFYSCYCNSSASYNNNSINIGNVTFGNLNNGIDTVKLNNPTAINNYSDFRNLSPISFQQGISDSISITLISNDNNLPECIISLFIDYNQDTIFDPTTECVFKALSNNLPKGNCRKGRITIPFSSLPGTTGMRVIASTYSYLTPNPCGNIFEGEVEDYLITIVPAPICMGAPIAGKAVSYLTDVCIGEKNDIHLVNVQSTSGLTYQWQQSFDSIIWQNISFANDSVLQIIQSNTSYFRCAISCGATNTSFSQSIKMAIRPSTLCYCSNNLGGESLPARNFINHVSVIGTSLNNFSAESPFINGSSITLFPTSPNTTCKMYRDSSYSLIVSTTGNMTISCWIDFDRNGIFNSNEWFLITASGITGVADTIEIVVPSSAKPGLTGMRIRAGADEIINDSTSACSLFYGEYISGEIEDYFITLQCIAPADNAGIITGSDSLVACLNQNNISYSIPPLNNAEKYIWNIPSGATFIGNADTNSIHLNFATNFSGGLISVFGSNNCGDGQASFLPIYFKPVPSAEICFAMVDSSTQNVLLTWEKPLETYITDYIIYRQVGSVFSIIDTVSNLSFSSYLDTGSHPILQSEKYKIAVIDSCGNVGDISTAYSHNSINLYGSIQPGGVAKLYWNDYSGSVDSKRYFNLLRDTLGNGAFNDTIAKGILPASYMNATDTTAANFPQCRYVAEMISFNNCAPSLRLSQILVNRIRSNIKNRIALIDSIIFNGNINTTPLVASIQLFPNPAKNKLTLKNLNHFEDYSVRLYTTIGKTILSNQIHKKNSFEMNVENLPAGFYFLLLQGIEKNHIFKVQIE